MGGHSEEILDLIDKIIPSNSRITDRTNVIIKYLTLTDDDLNEIIIQGKSSAFDLTQLDVEEEHVDNQVVKISEPVDLISVVAAKSKLPRQSSVEVQKVERKRH